MTCEVIDDEIKSDGSSTPYNPKLTLVFDAGMGNWSLFFQPLAQEVRRFARVCLLSRDGYLDSSTSPKDIVSIAQQMKETLNHHGIHEPVVFAGHSLGGIHVRMFQHLYPERVKALILLDAAHPAMLKALPMVKPNLEKQIRMVNILIFLARIQLLQFARGSIPTFGLPRSLHTQYFKVTTRASYYITYQQEMKGFEAALEQCKAAGSMGSLPLLIISSPYGLNQPLYKNAGSPASEDQAWQSLQKDLVGLSSNATFFKSTGDHFLHVTDTFFVSKAVQKFCSELT